MEPDLVRLNAVIAEYLAGRADVDATARAIHEIVGHGGDVWVHDGIGPPNAAEMFAALSERVQQLRRDEHLHDKRVTIQDCSTWPSPADPECFLQSLEVVVEARDAARQHRAHFRVWACTPAWLQRRAAGHGHMWTPGHIVITKWEPREIRRALTGLVMSGADNNWSELLDRLGRYLDAEDRLDASGTTAP